MDTGTILTAIIGTSAATIGIVLAKDAKVSEFRQQWIDGLRDDISNFIAATTEIYDTRRFIIPATTPSTDRMTILAPKKLVANSLTSRIFLRLDMDTPSHVRLNTSVMKLVTTSKSGTDDGEMMENVSELHDEAALVLDEAWERVKKGETRFRITFLIAFIALIASSAVGITHWLWLHQLVSQSRFALWLEQMSSHH